MAPLNDQQFLRSWQIIYPYRFDRNEFCNPALIVIIVLTYCPIFTCIYLLELYELYAQAIAKYFLISSQPPPPPPPPALNCHLVQNTEKDEVLAVYPLPLIKVLLNL